ncbi:MAG: type VI secretion system protein ImpD [Hyphomicrobiaceae bacterium]|jgi:type VI secretion system ImpC/EvpB family protein
MPASSDTKESLLDAVIANTREADAQREGRLGAFLNTDSDGQALVTWLGLQAGDAVPTRAELTARLTVDLALLDRRLSAQVNVILHSPEFQRLEASWRGVDYLVTQAAEADSVIIRVLDVNWRTVARDLDRAIEFDQSALFHKVYSDEFGTPGGQPYGLLLGDYYLAHRPRPDQKVDDARTLRSLAQVAAASFAPFIASAHPSLFGLDSFQGLGRNINLSRVFSGVEYTTWNSVRDLEDSRFLALTLPRTLMRSPWRYDPKRPDGFRFEEDVTASSGESYLWGNACFAFGGVVIRAFERSGWFGEIRGVEQGEEGAGLVTDLPVIDYCGQVTGVAPRPSTEVIITDSKERELSELGLISLCALQGLPWAAFYATPTLQRPARMDTPDATANARLSAMLQYMLCTARIAHYLKMMCRDRQGSYDSAAEIERSIGDWLFGLSTSENANPDVQARSPLTEASVSVREVPGKPGTYASIIHLRPHFQLDQMSSAIRLTTEILTPK